jgi:hypothetical protein
LWFQDDRGALDARSDSEPGLLRGEELGVVVQDDRPALDAVLTRKSATLAAGGVSCDFTRDGVPQQPSGTTAVHLRRRGEPSNLAPP